jgi:pilus assembly protein CpaB
VDVLLTRPEKGGPGGGPVTPAVTQAVAQNIRVLAIDQSDDDELNKPVVVKAITIQVTPDQAQSIVLAQSVGALSLALRHVTDDKPLNKLATTAASFGFYVSRNPSPAGAPRPRPPPGFADLGTVRVTRATDTTLYAVGVR